MKKGFRDAAALFLLFSALLPFNGALLLGRLPFDADNTLFTIPFFSLFRERPFPLWNPYQFCGMPLIGNLQYQMFYPLRVPFLFRDSTQVYGFYCFAHYLIAAWGAYWLGRTLALSRGACIFGAITFSCGGFIQGRISNPILFTSAVWFPCVLAATISLLQTPSTRRAAIFALIVAMLGTAGSPHGLFFAALMIALAWLWWSFVLPAGNRLRPARTMIWLVGAGLLGALLFCPTWYHALELLPHTVRSQATFAEVTADPLLPREIPWLWLGGISTPEYLDKTSYAGMLPLVLVCVMMLNATACKRFRSLIGGPAGFALLLCAAGIVIALGAKGGIYHLIYAVPGFKFLIGPTRALILFNLGWSLLAAISLDALLRQTFSRRTIGIIVLVMSGGIVLILMSLAHGSSLLDWLMHFRYAPPAPARWTLAGMGLLLSAGALMVARLEKRTLPAAGAIIFLHLLNLVYFNQRVIIRYELPDYFRVPSTVHFLKKQSEEQPWRVLSWEPSRMYMMDVNDARGPSFLMPKLPDYFRVREVQGYDPMMLREYVEFMTALAGRSGVDDPWRTAHVADPASVFTDLAGARFIIGYPWERNISRDPATRHIDISPTTVTAIGLTSLAHGATGAVDGTELGAITLIGKRATPLRLPIRAGIHTAELRAVNRDLPIRHRPVESNLRWRAFDSGLARELEFSNYYSRIHLAEPLEVTAVQWQGSQANSVFVVPNLTIESPAPPGQEGRFQPVFPAGNIAVYENTRALPRAYFADGVVEAGDVKAAAELLKQNAESGTRLAVVESGSNLAIDSDSTGTVRFRRWNANGVVIETVSTGSALLVLSDSFYPGRRAWIDGKETPVVRVNGIFQGVLVSTPGEHLIEFRYLPRSLLRTLCLAATALVAGIIALVRRRNL